MITSLVASAQATDYFADSPKWRLSSQCAIPYPCIESQEYVYYVNGDSTIEGLTYKKIFKHGTLYQYPLDEVDPGTCNLLMTFNQFHALLRQEEKKIFIYDEWDNLDTLLYDFELSIGDTLPLTYNQWNDDLVVTSIDSILIENIYRKIFTLNSDENPQLIEGIGHEHGFTEPFLPIFECAFYLNCFSINDTSIYPVFNESCDFNLDVEERSLSSDIIFYPNPVNDNLTIQIKSNEQIEEVCSYNIMGQQKIMKFQEIDENRISVELSSLKTGLYIIELKGNNKTLYSFKVLKN
jgi:hypothetical protein